MELQNTTDESTTESSCIVAAKMKTAVALSYVSGLVCLIFTCLVVDNCIVQTTQNTGNTRSLKVNTVDGGELAIKRKKTYGNSKQACFLDASQLKV